MNKIFTGFLIAFFVVTLIGCGSDNKAKIEKLADIQGKTIGAITSGISEANYRSMLAGLIGGPVKEVVYYNRGMEIFTALKTGKVDAMPIHQFAADYLVKRNNDIVAIPVEAQFEGGVIMAVRIEDNKLKVQLDSAITILKENNTLNKLVDEWITNLPATNEPSNEKAAKIEGSPTIYVGVTGEFVPLDYLAADGRPAGFNVAFLNEIGKILKLNFEFVSLESQARFAALASKKIDVVFCHFQSKDTKYFDDLKTNNWVSTIPYFTYKGGSFIVMR